MFVAAVDYLELHEFIAVFEKINWDKPAEVHLLIKGHNDLTFTSYYPKT